MSEIPFDPARRAASDSIAEDGSKAGVTRSLARLSVPLLLALTLGLALAIRLNGIDWDQSRHLHPDERYMTYLATLLKPPSSVGQYFDSGASPLNPFNTEWGSRYVYGTLPLFAARYFAGFLNGACESPPQLIPSLIARLAFPAQYARCGEGLFTSYDPMALVGRLMSALADTLSVLMVFAIGRKLFSARVGLLGAVLSALAVMQIQQAHFFTVDSVANAFVMLSLFGCVHIATLAPDARRYGLHACAWALFAGVFAGCAVASKISVWPLAPLIVLSVGVAWWRRAQTSDATNGAGSNAALVVALAFGGLSAFAAFRVAQPYSFVGVSTTEFVTTLNRCALGGSDSLVKICDLGARLPQPLRAVFAPSARWIEQLSLAQMFVNGTIDAPFGIQWANRTPIVFPLVNMLFYGLGLALGIAALSGYFVVLRRALKGERWWAYIVPLVWTGGYFVYQSTQWTKSIRYLLPIYPMLCLFGAVALAAAWAWANRARPNAGRRALAIGVGIVVVGFTAVWAYGFARIYNSPMSRIEASDWMYSNIPSAITLEWGDAADGSGGKTQLAAKRLSLTENLPVTISLGRNTFGDAPSTLKNPRVRLNHIEGEGRVTARLLDTASGTVLAEADAHVSPSQPVIAFADAQLVRGRDYAVELNFASSGASGELSARASVIANEHWDDALPAPSGTRASGMFYDALATSPSGLMENYNEDTPDKLPQLLNWLDEADYVVLSSNRLSASIPRLPWRFPMTNEYYRALFGGALGFELVADFNSFPRIGPIAFNDQEMAQTLARGGAVAGTPPALFVNYPTAEEAFSVYDHPRVLIFRKTPDFSLERAREVLGKFDLSRSIHLKPVDADNQPAGLMMTNAQRDIQQASGTWREIFPAGSPLNRWPALAVLAWLAMIEIVGLAAWPLIARATRDRAGRPTLFDAGYSFAKIFGLVCVAWVVFWLASLRIAAFSATIVWLTVGALVVAGAIVGWRDRARLREFVRDRAKLLVASEVVFLLAFGAWLLVRAGNPDLWHAYMGGEKPMDFAFLNGVLRSEYFPAMDPWFAGGYINYYYFGFVIVGALIKALGIDPSVAYNIALPMLFAMVACGAFGIGATLATCRAPNAERRKFRRAIVCGLLAALFVVGIGNVEEIFVFVSAWQKLGGVEHGVAPVEALLKGVLAWLDGASLPIFAMTPYWNATRIDPAVPIAEFPLFTFLYGDLHAHMLAMPLALSAIAFALAFAAGGVSGLGVGAGALVVGALFPTNTWDYPVYLVLCAAGLAIGSFARPRETLAQKLIWTVATVLVFFALTRALFAPFFEHFGTAYSSVQSWTGERTPFDVFLKIHIVFLLPLLTYLAVRATRSFRQMLRDSEWMLAALSVGAGATTVVLAGGAAVAGAPIGLVVVPLITLALLAAASPRARAQERIMWLMVAGGAMLTLAVEFVALKGDVGRMNTVFKFYLQAWLLLGTTAAVCAVWLLLPQPESGLDAAATTQPRTWVEQWPSLLGRGVFGVAMAILIALALVYPAFAIPAKVSDRIAPAAPRGLDGMAYMSFASRTEPSATPREFSLKHDYDAIRWMRENVVGSPTIIEGIAPQQLYRWANRFSVYTGLPTAVGWWWHTYQQRNVLPYSIVADRERDVTDFYSTTDSALARAIAKRYDARYVILGDLEKAYFDPRGQAKFDDLVAAGFMRVAYQNDGTTIYEILE